MAVIQILIMVFSLTGTVLLFVNLPVPSLSQLSLSHIFPVLAFIFAGASMLVKSSRFVQGVLMILAVILFCLFLGFIFFVFSTIAKWNFMMDCIRTINFINIS